MVYCVKCGNAVDESFAFCPGCGTRIVTPKQMETSVEVAKAPEVRLSGEVVEGVALSSAMKTSDLLEYISMAQKMEMAFSRLNEIHKNIRGQIYSLQQKVAETIQEQKRPEPTRPEAPKDLSKDEDEINRRYSGWSQDIPKLLRIGIPAIGMGAAAYDAKEKKKVIKQLEQEYEIALANYNRANSEYPQKLQMHNEYIISKKDEEKTLNLNIEELNKMKNQVEDNIELAASRMETFYSVNVLYHKYRGLKPTAAFYEYIASGRCNNIADCIDRYEDDVKHEQHIAALGRVEDAMSRYASRLYDISRSIEVGFSEISGGISAANENLAVSNYNSQMQLECQKQMSENIAALKWYEDWDHIRN